MIHFVIGTRAQLFKMAPVMLECTRRRLEWRWIYTAQHKETINQTLKTFELPKPDYTIFKWRTEAKTIGKIWYWFGRVLISLVRGKKILAGYTGRDNIILTHGDTLTTWWGALLGRLNGCKVMHVESGLRSFNLLKPFPEELNRLITFSLSHYYACPGDRAVSNLRNYHGEKINTGENTQIDTVKFGYDRSDSIKLKIPPGRYAVCSIHRYENVFNSERFSEIIDRLDEISRKYRVCWVQHPVTEERLKKLPQLQRRLKSNKNISIYPRLEYLPFINLIKNSLFVITDGGGNQEELFHMGIPTLIFRNETERWEGLGITAVLSKLDRKLIREFVNNPSRYRKTPRFNTKIKSPSEIIVDFLADKGFGRVL